MTSQKVMVSPACVITIGSESIEPYALVSYILHADGQTFDGVPPITLPPWVLVSCHACVCACWCLLI